jgi:DNA primase
MSAEVEKLLIDKGISYRASGQDYIIECLNPDHEDNNPSLRIDQVRGIGHCLSCGFKVNLFNYFGVIVNQVNMRVAGLKQKLKDLKVNTEGLPMMENPIYMNKVFRNISVSTLKEFEAFHTDSEPGMEDRLIFPIRDIGGKIRVFVGRHMVSKGNPRYMIQPAGAKMLMYPPALKEKSKYLVLVEGTFDMLNLYDNGLKAVSATMGTNTLNDKDANMRLLPFKAQGVTHIFILFDGDDPGREAADKLKPVLEILNYKVEIIPMEEGTDPGVMSDDEIEGVRIYCEEKSKLN